ncbi:Trigger factor, partial [Dissostichus eleginoides]
RGRGAIFLLILFEGVCPRGEPDSGRWSDTRKAALRGRRREERPQGRHAGSQSSADGGVTNRRLRISQLYENPEVYRPSVETGLDDCSGHAPFSTPPGGLCYPAPCRSLHLKAAYKGAKTRLLWGDGSSKAGLGVVLGVGSAEAQLELESSSHLSSHCRNKNGLHFHCNSVQEQRAEHK